MLGVGLGIAGAGALAVKAAINFEAAFAGVEKTVDGTEVQLSALSDGIREMSRELPATTTEIASVAEAAGALGVETDSILSFTRVMIDLGETTNLTADQAATAFARIANVMGTASSDFDRMGATVVELGNNGASTEAEIVELANRLAAAGEIAGLTEANVFAFAETLASVGVEAEAGGTALSKVFMSIRDAVIDGSDKLDVFARVAGTTTEAFSTAFAADPSGAIASFIEGLGGISDAGQSTTAVFEALELTDQRLMRALLSTGNAGDYLRGQIELANAAWEENSALTDEATKRYETTAAQIEVLRNNVTDLAISFGTALLPAIKFVADILGDFVDGFRELPGPMQMLIAGTAVLVGAVTLLGGGFLFLLPRIVATQTAFTALAGASPALAAGLRGVMIAAGGIGAVLTVASIAIAIFGDHNKDAVTKVNDFTEALRQQADGAKDAVRALIVKKLVDEDLDKTARKLGLSLDTIAAAIEGDAKALAKVKDATSAIEGVKEMTLLPRGEEMKKFRDSVLGMGADLDSAKDKHARAAAAARELGVDTEGVTSAIEDEGDALDELNEIIDTYLGKVLGVQQASDAWSAGLIDLATQLRDNTDEFGRAGASLQGFSDSALDNRDAMGSAVERAASWVEMMIGQRKSQDEIAAGLAQMAADLIATATAYGVPIEQARTYANMILGIPTSVDTSITVDTSQAHTAIAAIISELERAGVMVDAVGVGLAYMSGQVTAPAAPTRGVAAPARPPSGSGVSDRERSEQAVNDFLKAMFEQRVEIAKNYYDATGEGAREYMKLLDEQLAHEIAYTNRWVQLQDERARVAREAMRTQRMLYDTLTGGYFQAKPGEEAIAARRAMGSSYQLVPSYTAASTSNSTTTTIQKVYNVNGDIVAAANADDLMKQLDELDRRSNLIPSGGGGW
jgi:TP901 family phage tail tape measure protein